MLDNVSETDSADCACAAQAHRGRLNILVNLLQKPPGTVFSEMDGRNSEFHVGDVKYHLGVADQRYACAAPLPCVALVRPLLFGSRAVSPL